MRLRLLTTLTAMLVSAIAFAAPTEDAKEKPPSPSQEVKPGTIDEVRPGADEGRSDPGALRKGSADPNSKVDPASAMKEDARAVLIDLNAASTKELRTLPKVSARIARKIVASRPYADKAELVARKIVSAADYERIRGLVTAGSK